MRFRSSGPFSGSTTFDTPDQVWEYQPVSNVDQFARIADALERIATALETPARPDE